MLVYLTNREGKPPAGAQFPCASLAADNWNDFGYRTLFQLRVYRHKSAAVIDAGDVKILQRGASITKPPREFIRLDNSFCSLGQSLSYYSELNRLELVLRNDLLQSLRDIAFTPGIAAEFEAEEGFKASLLRYTAAETALSEMMDEFAVERREKAEKALVQNANPSFTFRIGMSPSSSLDIDFEPDASGLHRAFVLIGRNGVGKTSLLAEIADTISGESRESSRLIGKRPAFTQVLAVSYSAFDRFRRPNPGSRSFSYSYLGIRAPDGRKRTSGRSISPVSRLLRVAEIYKKISAALEKIALSGRSDFWCSSLSVLLGDTMVEGNLSDELLAQSTRASRRTPAALKRLSSGQLVVLLVASELIARISESALVLLDEPELHLHPEALSRFMYFVHLLLEKYSSFAVLATHSPLVLQEVPSRRVRVLERHDDVVVVAKLPRECFGESVSVLTSDVFGAGDRQFGYREQVSRIAKQIGSVDELKKAFPLGLSAAASAHLMVELSDKQSGGNSV